MTELKFFIFQYRHTLQIFQSIVAVGSKGGQLYLVCLHEEEDFIDVGLSHYDIYTVTPEQIETLTKEDISGTDHCVAVDLTGEMSSKLILICVMLFTIRFQL